MQISLIGPRNRRRLTWAGAGLGVVAVIVTAVWLTRPPSHSGPGSVAGRSGNSASASSGGSASSPGSNGPTTFDDTRPVLSKLVYGMTKQQVLRLDGQPAKVVRVKGLPCWQYPVNQYVPASGGFKAYTLNAVGLCFFAGKYAIYHYKTDGKWDYNPNPISP